MTAPRKLAITIGPYRNLTTLTAALLSLHPEVQVLNHAAERFWVPGNDLDFLATPDRPTYDRFMDAAWDLSAAGERGDQGGSILHSHAYDSEKVKSLYRARYGECRVKANARWLVWKESMRVQYRLMQSEDMFDRLCEAFPGIRFILPLRNPLDCAASNLSTKLYINTLHLPPSAGLPQILETVLEAFAWALQQRDRHPDRVFAFTQNEKPRAIFESLAAFLGIDPGEQWLNDAAAAFVVRIRYQHSEVATAHARSRLAHHLAQWPDLVAALG